MAKTMFSFRRHHHLCVNNEMPHFQLTFDAYIVVNGLKMSKIDVPRPLQSTYSLLSIMSKKISIKKSTILKIDLLLNLPQQPQIQTPDDYEWATMAESVPTKYAMKCRERVSIDK